jgi:hypothetical protein
MIDELVLTKLQSFLQDKAQISALLRETRCRPAEIGSGLEIARKSAESLTSAAAIPQNVADLVARVTVSSKRLNISINRDRLLAMLTDKFAQPSQDTRTRTTSSHSRRPFPPHPVADPANSFLRIKMAKHLTPLS